MGFGGNSYFNAFSSRNYKRYSQGSANSQSSCSYTTTVNADGSTTTVVTCSNGTITKTEYSNGSFTTVIVSPYGKTTLESVPTENGTSVVTITFPNGETVTSNEGYWSGPSSPYTSIYLL